MLNQIGDIRLTHSFYQYSKEYPQIALHVESKSQLNIY